MKKMKFWLLVDLKIKKEKSESIYFQILVKFVSSTKINQIY